MGGVLAAQNYRNIFATARYSLCLRASSEAGGDSFHNMKTSRVAHWFGLMLTMVAVQLPAQVTVTLEAGLPAKAISPDLMGIFFEDINYSADGGLYAELVQNRSFEYSADARKEWRSLTSWELVQRGGGAGSVEVATATPLNANNPHYAILSVVKPGDGVGLMNSGFDGIPLKAGERYEATLFFRAISGHPGLLTIRLENKTGAALGETTIQLQDG